MKQNSRERKDDSLGMVNLSKQHPISILVDYQRTLWLLAPLLTALLCIRYLPYAESSITPHVSVSLIRESLVFLSSALGALWLILLVYQRFFRKSIYYGVQEGQLVFSRGIVLRQHGFFQLSRITEVYLERSLLDLIFGLYTLHISTPTAISDRFARIDGLDGPTATALQQKLSRFLENSQSFEDRGAIVRIARPKNNRIERAQLMHSYGHA